MGLSNYKLTDSDISQKGVVSAPDQLTGTAAENKAVFDRLIREAVKGLYNGLIDELSGEGGAAGIGAAELSGIDGDDVQALLGGLKDYIDDGLAEKQAVLSFDDTPTADSDNPVKSGGVKSYVDGHYVTAGQRTGMALGTKATAEGGGNVASGASAHAEGAGNGSAGIASHAEGNSIAATGHGAHAEGNGIVMARSSQYITGTYEAGATTYTMSDLSNLYVGAYIVRSDRAVFSEITAIDTENSTITVAFSMNPDEPISSTPESGAQDRKFSVIKGCASGQGSHSEGEHCNAKGQASHAEGTETEAAGKASHSEGASTTASGYASHAGGRSTVANHRSQHVFGEYNVADGSAAAATERGDYVEIVGNGTGHNARSDARTLDWNGNETLAGKLTLGAAPTANMDAATKQYVDDAAAAALPAVNASDNGKVLTVANGAWVAANLPTYNGQVVIS